MGRRTRLPLGELGDTRHLLGFRGKFSESAPAPVRARSFRGPAGRAEYFSLWEKSGARGAYMVFAENLRKSRPRACARVSGPRGPRRTRLPLGELGDTRHLLGFRGKSSEIAPACVPARGFRLPAGHAEH